MQLDLQDEAPDRVELRVSLGDEVAGVDVQQCARPILGESGSLVTRHDVEEVGPLRDLTANGLPFARQDVDAELSIPADLGQGLNVVIPEQSVGGVPQPGMDVQNPGAPLYADMLGLGPLGGVPGLLGEGLADDPRLDPERDPLDPIDPLNPLGPPGVL